MGIYQLSTGAKLSRPRIVVAAVLDAGSSGNRFLAMEQLLDIAERKLQNPAATIETGEYTYASKGAVAELPVGNPAMYEQHDVPLLFAKNAETQAIPASTTKVMSLVTGLPYITDIKEIVTIHSSDVKGGSGPAYAAGDTLTIEDLMYSMMLPSSNTAAVAFARVVGQKIIRADNLTDTAYVNAFIDEMGVKAAKIGLDNSVWTSPSGIPETVKTTAHDLIRVMIEACSYPDILRIWGKASYTVEVGGTDPRNVTLTSTVRGNAAIEAKYKVLGGKTGILESGGPAAALVMVAEVEV